MASVVEREKHWVAFKSSARDDDTSLLLYRTLQPEYQYAHCLSHVKWFSNRRLLSSFSSGCDGLRAETEGWEDYLHLDRKDTLLSGV